MLDMTRTGGKRYTPGETERIIHDGFIVQVPMAFEDYTYLSVDKGQHGSYLPIQLEPDTVIYFYPWWDLQAATRSGGGQYLSAALCIPKTTHWTSGFRDTKREGPYGPSFAFH